MFLLDLRYVYCSLLNSDGLIEINDDFPNHLIDRLEFDDNLIRTVFDNLLKTCFVQRIQGESKRFSSLLNLFNSSNYSDRLKTLDWEDFRDVLFPILTGRYTERHLRKLFDLFDINQTGYLFSKELTGKTTVIIIIRSRRLSLELLELIQVKNASQYAAEMTHEKENLNIEGEN